MNLPYQCKDIAVCFFIKEMSLKETSDYLDIPKTTVFDRKKKFKKYYKLAKNIYGFGGGY